MTPTDIEKLKGIVSDPDKNAGDLALAALPLLYAALEAKDAEIERLPESGNQWGATAMAYPARAEAAEAALKEAREGLGHCSERLQKFLDTFGDLGGCTTHADLNDWTALLSKQDSGGRS